jgi:uncharacterized protein
MSRPHFLEAVLRTTGDWGLRIAGRDTFLATHAELAGHSQARTRGLLGRDELPAGHALVLAPCQGVHTFGMRFPLDIVAVARDGTVVAVRRHVPRRRVVFALRAFAVVELAAGACETVKLTLGDRLLSIASKRE